VIPIAKQMASRILLFPDPFNPVTISKLVYCFASLHDNLLKSIEIFEEIARL